MSKPICPGSMVSVRRGEICAQGDDVVVDPLEIFLVFANRYGRICLLGKDGLYVDVFFYEPPEILV